MITAQPNLVKKLLHIIALTAFALSIVLYVSYSYRLHQQSIANRLEEELLDNRINTVRSIILSNPYMAKALADSGIYYNDQQILEITEDNKAKVAIVEIGGIKYKNGSDALDSVICRQAEEIFNHHRADSVRFLPIKQAKAEGSFQNGNYYSHRTTIMYPFNVNAQAVADASPTRILRMMWKELVFCMVFILTFIAAYLSILKMYREQKRKTESKNQFINYFTHEMKTPLATIRACNDSLSILHSDTETQGIIGTSNDKVDSINNMINKILLTQKLNLEKLRPVFSETDLIATLEKLIQELAQSHAIISFSDNSNGLARNFITDGNIVAQIVRQLINNAIIYCERTPEVRLSLSKTKHGICLSVHDNGIGIRPEDQDRIFDVFFRASNINRGNGTGLGLSIAQQMANLIHAKLFLKQSDVNGSEFVLEIPYPTHPQS